MSGRVVRPGTVLWLLGWDLRLAWRTLDARLMRSKTPLPPWRTLLNLALLAVILHFIAWSLLVAGQAFHPDEPIRRMILDGVVLSALLSGLSMSLATAVNLLFVRSDLDLLCSSPLPVRRVFAARGLSIAVQAIALPGLMGLAAANVAAFQSGPRWLAAYPVALAVGLTATAVGLCLTILLVRAIGPRRARFVALLLSTLLGATFFLTIQAPNLLGHERGQRWAAGLKQWAADSASGAPDSWLWYPARALCGEAWPLLCVLAVGAVSFTLAVLWLPRGFAYALRHAAGAAPATIRGPATLRFRAGLWRLMLSKEWRLILRDPQMLTLLLQQLLGLLPAVLLLGRGHANMPAAAAHGSTAAVATFIIGLLAGTVAWLVLSAEDAPELLAAAPHPRGQLRLLKLAAALAPLWLCALPLAIWVAGGQPWLLLAMLLCMAGGSLSIGVCQLWLPLPGSRRDLRSRMRRGAGEQPDRVVVQIAIQFGWSGFAFCFTAQYWTAAAVLLPVALAGPLYAWLRRRDAALLY